MSGLLLYLVGAMVGCVLYLLAFNFDQFITRYHRRVDVRAGTAAPMRSYHDGDKLTEMELSFINKYAYCPDCKEGRMLQGPEGGITMNIACDNPACGSRFNWCPMFAERISAVSPKKDTQNA